MPDEGLASPQANTLAPLVITLAIQAVVSMALLTLPVMAPVIAGDLHVPTAWVGVYIAMAYVGAMLSSLSAGAAVDKWGAIRASQIGLGLCALGLALCSVASLPTMAVGAVLIGLGYGPVTPASSHLLAKTTPVHRMSLVFSIKQTGVPLGGLMAGALVPTLALTTGWRGSLWVVAVVALLCAALAQTLRQSLDVGRNPLRVLALGNLTQPLKLIARHPALKRLAAYSFVFSIAQLCLTTYLVTFLFQEIGQSLVAAGLVLSVGQAAGIVGRVGWGWLSDRFLGARRMLALLAGLMTASCAATALLGQGTPTWVLLAIVILFGASAVGWNGVYLAEVARQAPPGMASVATGGTLTVTFFGVVVGPPLFGLIVNLTGTYRAGYAAVGVLTLLCLAALWRDGRQQQQP